MKWRHSSPFPLFRQLSVETSMIKVLKWLHADHVQTGSGQPLHCYHGNDTHLKMDFLLRSRVLGPMWKCASCLLCVSLCIESCRIFILLTTLKQGFPFLPILCSLRLGSSQVKTIREAENWTRKESHTHPYTPMCEHTGWHTFLVSVILWLAFPRVALSAWAFHTSSLLHCVQHWSDG